MDAREDGKITGIKEIYCKPQKLQVVFNRCAACWVNNRGRQRTQN